MYRISIILLFVFWQHPTAADQTIEITEGMRGAIPIAIVPFHTTDEHVSVRDELNSVIAADLTRTGRFNVLSEQGMLSFPHGNSDVNFREWRLLGQEALVVGQLRLNGSKYVVQFLLFDVLQKVQLAAYKTDPTLRTGIRDIAHWIADNIYAKLTDTPGAFSTRIAYVTAELDPAGKRQDAIMIADSNGDHPQPIVQSAEPLMSPTWSPDGKKLAYVSFEGKKHAVYIQDLLHGTRQSVAAYPGINSAPAWAPDGEHMALALSRDGNPEIYILELRNGGLTRITNNPAIDTEPTWSKDGSKLAFTSDRGGTPQIYQVAITGGEPELLTTDGDYNARPIYSPDGHSLALVTRRDREFRIGLLHLDNKHMRELTTGPLDESPSFLGNGSMIIYSAKTMGRHGLFEISVDGKLTRRIATNVDDVRDPACSPLIK